MTQNRRRWWKMSEENFLKSFYGRTQRRYTSENTNGTTDHTHVYTGTKTRNSF